MVLKPHLKVESVRFDLKEGKQDLPINCLTKPKIQLYKDKLKVKA